MADISEDLLAFAYATNGRTSRHSINTCPFCDADMEENDEGEMSCPECDD